MGSLAASLFLLLPSTSVVWYLSALLAICANVGFGASVVAMNSYIPSLAKEAPEVVSILTKLQQIDPDIDVDNDPDTSTESASAPLLASTSPEALDNVDKRNKLQAEYQAELSRTTARISSFGIAVGYGAGIGMLIVALIPVTMLHGSTFALRLAIGLSGIWWALFTVPAALWLPSASSAIHLQSSPTPNGRREEMIEPSDKDWSFTREIGAAWIRLGNMLRWREIKKLRNTFKYLAAWFLLSDGTIHH